MNVKTLSCSCARNKTDVTQVYCNKGLRPVVKQRVKHLYQNKTRKQRKNDSS